MFHLTLQIRIVDANDIRNANSLSTMTIGQIVDFLSLWTGRRAWVCMHLNSYSSKVYFICVRWISGFDCVVDIIVKCDSRMFNLNLFIERVTVQNKRTFSQLVGRSHDIDFMYEWKSSESGFCVALASLSISSFQFLHVCCQQNRIVFRMRARSRKTDKNNTKKYLWNS